MAGESQAWKDTADDIFLSFGDVVSDALVVAKSNGVYDSASGGYTEVESTIATKVVAGKRSKEFVQRNDTNSTKFDAFVLRGSDFSSPPRAGQILRIGGVDKLITEVEPDSAQTGAYYRVYVGTK